MKHQIELEGGRLTVNIDAIQYLDAPKEISEMNRATAKRRRYKCEMGLDHKFDEWPATRYSIHR